MSTKSATNYEFNEINAVNSPKPPISSLNSLISCFVSIKRSLRKNRPLQERSERYSRSIAYLEDEEKQLWAALEDLDEEDNSPGARHLRRMHAAALRQIYLEHTRRIGGRKEVSKIGNLITEIYANGAELLVEGSRIGIKGNPPQFIYNEVEECKKELLEALTGDPLQGPGWEARTALYREALRYLDDLIERDELDEEATTRALCRPETADRLNEAWLSGDFEEYRAALKNYVRVGLRAARGAGQEERMVMQG